MDFQEFSSFECDNPEGLFPVSSDDGTTFSLTEERTSSVVSFTPVNIEPDSFYSRAMAMRRRMRLMEIARSSANDAVYAKLEEDEAEAEHDEWRMLLPNFNQVGNLLLDHGLIRRADNCAMVGGRTRECKRAPALPDDYDFNAYAKNRAYFRSNIVHAHLKLMPIATHTLFERKEIAALVFAALGGLFALFVAGGRMLALVWLSIRGTAPSKKQGGAGPGGAANGGPPLRAATGMQKNPMHRAHTAR